MNLKAGDKNYKSFIGPVQNYDILSLTHFNVLTNIGLRQHQKVLDVGCGSLRSGKLLIPFLNKGNYYGVEPEKWLIEEGIKNEIGQGMIDIKKPEFHHFSDFKLSRIDQKFDFIFSHSVFTHASKKQILTYLREAKKILTEKGVIVSNFSIGTKDYEGDEWVYPECVDYTLETVREMSIESDLSNIFVRWKIPHLYQTHIFCLRDNYPMLYRHVANLLPTIVGSDYDFLKNEPFTVNIE